jgi:hypothetical protein
LFIWSLDGFLCVSVCERVSMQDTHSAFEDGIASLSLGAPIVMEFQHPDGRKVRLWLPPRSLLIMTGEARYQWTHVIALRRYARHTTVSCAVCCIGVLFRVFFVSSRHVQLRVYAYTNMRVYGV